MLPRILLDTAVKFWVSTRSVKLAAIVGTTDQTSGARGVVMAVAFSLPAGAVGCTGANSWFWFVRFGGWTLTAVVKLISKRMEVSAIIVAADQASRAIAVACAVTFPLSAWIFLGATCYAICLGDDLTLIAGLDGGATVVLVTTYAVL